MKRFKLSQLSSDIIYVNNKQKTGHLTQILRPTACNVKYEVIIKQIGIDNYNLEKKKYFESKTYFNI